MNRSIAKRTITVFVLVFFMLTVMVFNFSSASGTDAVKKKILIVSPHEDDESIACAGVIKSAVDRGDDVKVMYVTNGDYSDNVNLAEQRAAEVVAAMATLGLGKDNLYYLGYGDMRVLDPLYFSKDNPENVVSAYHGETQTHGFSDTLEDYHYMTTGAHAEYCRQNVLADIQDIINKYRPDDIYMPSGFELHPDHKLTSLFTTEAILNIKKAADYSPVIHEYMVYKYGFPQAGVDYYALPVPYTNDTANTDYTSPYNWADRESVAVPAEMSSHQTCLNILNVIGEGAKITTNDPYGMDDINRSVFDNYTESSYISSLTNDSTTITVTFPYPENIDNLIVLTRDDPASTFITVEAADTAEDLANKNQSYVSLVQDLESTASDWEKILANSASNLKIWRFTFRSSVADNPVNVRGIDFYTGNLKGFVLREYASQTGLEKWGMADEIFWKKTMSSLSYSASTTASSENCDKQQYANKVNDGIVLGDGIYKYRNDQYWQDPTRVFDFVQNLRNQSFEWVTLGVTKKPWINLEWKEPVTANRIVLYDRLDLDENILSAKLTFSDGSSMDIGPSINIGPLNKNGSGTVIDFKTRTFRWVKLTVEKAEGTSTGLAEFEVYKMP